MARDGHAQTATQPSAHPTQAFQYSCPKQTKLVLNKRLFASPTLALLPTGCGYLGAQVCSQGLTLQGALHGNLGKRPHRDVCTVPSRGGHSTAEQMRGGKSLPGAQAGWSQRAFGASGRRHGSCSLLARCGIALEKPRAAWAEPGFRDVTGIAAAMGMAVGLAGRTMAFRDPGVAWG